MIVRRPRVFTIPAGVPFVDALAARLLAETGGDPLALSRYSVLLPTRRACRALRDAFLRRSGGKPLLLPRLTPLGDIDEEMLELDLEPPYAEAALELPPAIPELRRRLLLAELILEMDRRPLEQAIHLAGELARLLDRVETERLGFERLAELVPERYAEHWQITLEFLRVVTERWPEVLAEEGALDPVDRRNRLMAARIAAWRERPPQDPVIAAGSTGSIPATADLLALVATLPDGRLVLPGLDRHTDADAWALLEPSHPQYGLKLLLERLEIDRRDVEDWPLSDIFATPPARAALIAEAMRPAGSTDAWRRLGAIPKEALDGLTRIDAPTPREEAATVALLLREALETPGRTAAFVTPDRSLARRVAAELERWGIEIDDSAGTPLAKTPPGTFLSLVAAAVAEQFAPVPLLALLKHPLAAGGWAPAQLRADARLLETELLRGPRPGPGFDGLRQALGERGDKDPEPMSLLIERLDETLGPFIAIMAERRAAATSLLAAHIAAAEALAATPQESGPARLWAGEAGEAAALFVAELGRVAGRFPEIAGDAYPGFFAALMADRVVRPRYGRHARLAIWGAIEARLQHADLVILGGLNEGTWPPQAAADPWMSRPMRQDFGLPQPERRIGLSAHDFAQAACAPRVVLTRALKTEGTPTVPARWLLRLDSLLRATDSAFDAAAPARWSGWQRALDRPLEAPKAWPPPAPKPPVEWRPRKLSVTEIETWMRDPYAIYARHVLTLRPLDPLDADPGAADRGSFIHDALDRFLGAFPQLLPADAVERLLGFGEDAFGRVLERPGVRAFWWPRFVRVAEWFVAHERERRQDIAATHSEIKGEMILRAPLDKFTLTARADRIDRLRDGGLAVIDYKTGQLPKVGDTQTGFAPQLALEAAMAEGGFFAGVAPDQVRELAFWRLSGGEPAGEVRPIRGVPTALAAQAIDGLHKLIAAFDDPATRYEARPRAALAPRYSDYEHLARVREWAALEVEGE